MIDYSNNGRRDSKSGEIVLPWYLPGSLREPYERWFSVVETGETPQKEQMFHQFVNDTVELSKCSPAFFGHNYGYIRTKEGGLTPFNSWTPAQRKLYIALTQSFGKKPARFIVLKARQMGISTLSEMLLFWRVYFYPYSNALLATHEEDASNNLFAMLKCYYENIPGEAGNPVWWKWDTVVNNTEQIVFDNPKSPDRRVLSGCRVKTVALGGTSRETQGKGRSQTIHAAHFSEVAFWSEPKRFWTGVAQTIPKLPTTMCIMESTANGYGNWFHEFWKRSSRGWNLHHNAEAKTTSWRCVEPEASSTSYTPLFFSWLMHPEYQAPIQEKRWTYRRTLSKEEKSIVDSFSATLEQIQWRRMTIADECGGDVKTFNQEYPTTPEEAFVTSGRRVFDMNGLKAQEDRIRITNIQVKRGDYDVTPKLDLKKEVDGWDVQWRSDDYGPVRVWKEPILGAEYVIGVDTCYNTEKGDFACVQVLRRDNWEQVAQAHARMDSDQTGDLTYALAVKYNEALVVVEIDGPGINTIHVLNKGKSYWNMYRRQTFDGVSSAPQSSWGWRMSSKARQFMVQKLKVAVREREVILHDLETVKEMREWMLTPTTHGKAKEQPADPTHGHDDRITSLGIALAGGLWGYGTFQENAHVEVERADHKETERGVYYRGPLVDNTKSESHGVLGENW